MINIPKEETIELRHIRGVIGEKEDLPTYRQKSSSMSKLKTILLKLIGTPQQIHNFGTFAIDKVLTLNPADPQTYAIYTDGNYLYVGISGALIKIDLETYTEVSRITYSGYVGNLTTWSIASDGTSLYVGITENLIKININSFTTTEFYHYSAGHLYPIDIVITGGYIYVLVGTNGPTAEIKKIDITTFTVTSTLSMTTDDANDMILEGRYLYVITNGAVLEKIDIDTFTIITSLALPATKRGLYSDGNHVYVGGTNLLQKIDLLTYASLSTITWATGEYITDIISDGSYLYISLSGTHLLIVDIATFTIIKNVTSPYNINKMTTDNLFIYMSTLTGVPGRVYRMYLVPTINSDSRQISNINTDVISILDNSTGTVTNGTYSHSNDTNENNVLVFAAAKLKIDLFLDMVNIVQNTTIREYIEVDGTTYRLISQKVFPTDFDSNTKSVVISIEQPNKDYKVTFQSGTAEGSAKDVPYSYITLPRT